VGDWERVCGDAAIELAYAELLRVAHNRIRGQRHTATRDATGLAHEAFMRLVDQNRVQWQNRAQFVAIAARTMRRILVDRHRAQRAEAHRRARSWPASIAMVSTESIDVSTPSESSWRRRISAPTSWPLPALRPESATGVHERYRGVQIRRAHRHKSDCTVAFG
jgi:DNA-directed RNA polymerase specialized sigma24 family protein